MNDTDIIVIALSSKFNLGPILVTPGAEEATSTERLGECLQRHSQGDWGDLDEHDKAEADRCLRVGNRLLSRYRIDPEKPSERGNLIYIITEHDRSATTVLLPEEY